MGWAGHVARVGESIDVYRGSLREDHLEGSGVDSIKMDLRDNGWISID
jgi:hypothetical protein